MDFQEAATLLERGRDLRLQPNEMDKRALSDTPYFKLWVKTDEFEEEQLAYIDTSAEQMLYHPLTYTGSFKTNLSIVMVIRLESPGVYSLSNVVLPKNGLIPTGAIKRTGGNIVYGTSYQIDGGNKFTRVINKETNRFALYTLIDNDSDKRAYLLPQVDKQQPDVNRRYVMRLVQSSDKSPNDKYVFSTSESPYTMAEMQPSYCNTL